MFYKDPNDNKSHFFDTCFHCRNYSDNFRKCYSKDHEKPCVNSPYIIDKVPIKMFYKDSDNPKGKIFKYCFHCRIYNQKFSKKKKEELKKEISKSNKEADFFVCSNKDHASYYKYPWNKVPKSEFLENPEDPNSKIFKSCSECRVRKRNKNLVLKNKVEEERKKKDKNNKNWVCSHRDHNTRSAYPREETPIEMFMKNPKDPKSGIFEHCSDCRAFSMNISHKIRDRIRSSIKEDEFFCEGCKNLKI